MDKTKPVLVVGATGFLGSAICHQLRAAGYAVRGMIRTTSDPGRVKALTDMGVETVTGDIKDRSSLDNACRNAGAVISTVSSTLSRTEGDNIETVDKQGQLNVVETAANAGVQKFVFISFPESPYQFPLQDAKRAVEKRLIKSEMDYTILRPSFFMEVWLGPHLGFDAANSSATIYGQGVNKISFIAIRDVAAFAVAALENPAAHNLVVEIGGPDALSPLEVVKIFEEQTGTSFALRYVPEEALRAQMESATDPLQKSFAGLMLTYASGSDIPMTETLQRFPLKLTSVADYCRNIVQPKQKTMPESAG